MIPNGGQNCKDDVASALLVLLYFGLRQIELPILKVIDGNTLECETSKERIRSAKEKRPI